MLTQRGGDDLATWLKWMKSLLPAPTTAQRLKLLASLLATPAALLLSGGRAEAILTYNIFESGSDVVVQTSGSLNLPSRISESGCGSDGYVISSQAIVCTGPNTPTNVYTISDSNFFNSTASISGANSFSGITTGLFGFMSQFHIVPAYVNNTPIVSSSTYNNYTLASLGFTSGQTLNGDSPSVLPPCLAYSDAESVSLNVGFYYMANAAGRLLGTVLSGGLFLVGGMQAYLWASCLLVALAFLAGLRLPPPLRQKLSPA